MRAWRSQMLAWSWHHCLPFTDIEVVALAARRALDLTLEINVDRIVLEGDFQINIYLIFCKQTPIPWLTQDISYVKDTQLCSHCNYVSHSLARRVLNSTLCQFEWMIYHQMLNLFLRLINLNTPLIISTKLLLKKIKT